MKIQRLISLSFLIFPLSFTPVLAQRLTVSNTNVNAGRTGFQQPITAIFELKNKSRKKLLIESVKPDCGCTAVEFPKEVDGGANFTIKMTYDAKMLGHFQKMAVVTSNGSTKPVFLTMKGVVLPETLDYSGTYPLSMGDLLLDKNELEYDDVSKGDAPQQEIHILNNGEEMMHPNIMHLPPYLSATVMPEDLAPGKSGTITITLNSDKLRDFGLTQTSVYLAQRLGEKVSQNNEIPISAILLPHLQDYDQLSKQIAPNLQMSSTEVDFTNFEGKKKKASELILQNIGKTTLKITSMQLFTTGLKVTLSKQTLEPNEIATLKITGIAEDLAKLRRSPRILMITNDPDHAKVIITIRHK